MGDRLGPRDMQRAKVERHHRSDPDEQGGRWQFGQQTAGQEQGGNWCTQLRCLNMLFNGSQSETPAGSSQVGT